MGSTQVVPVANSTHGGSAGAKGTWVEAIASTAADATRLVMMTRHGSGTNSRGVTDIGIGAAGSEVVLVPDVLVDQVWAAPGVVLDVPVSIPAGSRLAVRSAGAVASQTHSTYLYLLSEAGLPVLDTLSAFGLAGGYQGTDIDPGATANTKGAWVEFAASTAHQIDRLWMAWGMRDNSAPSAFAWSFDVGVGAAGSEVVHVADVYQAMAFASTHQAFGQPALGGLAVDIPAGSRIAVRSSCTGTDATDRILAAMLYGAYMAGAAAEPVPPGLVL